MAEAVDQTQHEFWRAPQSASMAVAVPERSSTCRCGTEFLVTSLFCHACGARRSGVNAESALHAIPGLAELASLGNRLSLTIPAVIAFLVGLICMAGALAVGLFFSARTALDWQAIQLWRIQWLLAAIAAFAAGCLLKK
jgi:hypothetical protein